jgi:hypothetical protein
MSISTSSTGSSDVPLTAPRLACLAQPGNRRGLAPLRQHCLAVRHRPRQFEGPFHAIRFGLGAVIAG